MKHYIAGSTKLPAGMDKYYRYATIKTLANEGLIELSEAEDYVSGMKETCEDNDVEFVGLAIAKDEYKDKLSKLGDNIVTIVKEGNDTKLVVYRDDKLRDISTEVERAVKATTTIRASLSPQILSPFKYVGEYDDGSSIEVGGDDEDECIYKLIRLADQHGDLIWYSGVTDTNYVDGELTSC